MKTLLLLCCLIGCLLSANAQQAATPDARRMEWLKVMDKVVRPVFENMAANRLKEAMPKEISIRSDNPANRIKVQYLEAMARAFCGIAPWLQQQGGSTWELKLRAQYTQWVVKSIQNAADSTQKDFVVWEGGQPLVDAAFLAYGLIKAPRIWEALGTQAQQNVVYQLQKTRSTVPGYSNWLLFSGMIEAFFLQYGYPYDALRIDYGVKTFMNQWYTGDGMFSDGMPFHVDYYNSFVIQPFLKEIIGVCISKTGRYKAEAERLAKINDRYTQIQERSIMSDGSFPAYGRSIVYRSGAFHHLANMALFEQLPKDMAAAQVREALWSVTQKTLLPPATYDAGGWMVIGLAGKQPHLADVYNNQGSLYLCSLVFLPLGLPPTASFWADAPKPWSAVTIWGGGDYEGDKAW